MHTSTKEDITGRFRDLFASLCILYLVARRDYFTQHYYQRTAILKTLSFRDVLLYNHTLKQLICVFSNLEPEFSQLLKLNTLNILKNVKVVR